MAGIAGISAAGKEGLVAEMLLKINHRGGDWTAVRSVNNTTLGITGKAFEIEKKEKLFSFNTVSDSYLSNRRAGVCAEQDGLVFSRDLMGIAPLSIGRNAKGVMCFASEVKALLLEATDIQALSPGFGETSRGISRKSQATQDVDMLNPQPAARRLAMVLEEAVARNISREPVIPTGAWLSGGLDSSIIALLASKYIDPLHTFAVGLRGAPDLVYARRLADILGTSHHEIIVTNDDILSSLPQTIYHLESFDRLLVRSSLLNFLAAKAASNYVAAVFSGEGADELFAGYEYLKALEQGALEAELNRLLAGLHKTALQRVDRCASAFGLIPILPFLEKEVIEIASQIPLAFKLRDDIEKWILRRAFMEQLPIPILYRKKAKFWQGGGVQEMLNEIAEREVTDYDFLHERVVNDEITLNSKEELLYYRLFKEHFGNASNFNWVGRTKVTPNNE